MTKTQVNNIINFSFHFHQSMGCKIKEFSPDYLEEKFKSYFGMVPRKISSSEINILNQYLEFSQWKKIWRSEYIDHLFFIYKLNTKVLDTKYKKETAWRPSELVSLFEECIGDPNMIVDRPYDGLHIIIKYEITEWLLNDEIDKDYKSVMREVKIDNILS